MTRIDFYLVPGEDAQGLRTVACRLAEKAYRQGYTVYLRTASEKESRSLDELLWTFRQGSFVPHEIYSGESKDTPVSIGHGARMPEIVDVLINLDRVFPSGFDRFARVAELINDDEAVKAAGRLRYKGYQEQGYSPQIHNLDRIEVT